MPPRKYAESEDQEITKDDLPPELVEYIDALEDALDATVDRVQKQDAQIEELTKGKTNAADLEGASGGEDDDEDEEGNARPARKKKGVAESGGKSDPMSKADPALRDLIEKQAEEVKKANERAEAAEELAKAERQQRLTREFVAKAQTMPMIAENPEELGSLLMDLNELDPSMGEKVEKLFKAANEGLRQGDLFGEIGRHGGSVTSSPAIEAAAEVAKQANPELTPEQAIAKAYEDNPALYDDEIREARMNGR